MGLRCVRLVARGRLATRASVLRGAAPTPRWRVRLGRDVCARWRPPGRSYARASARLSAVAGKAELYVTLTRRDRAARSRALCRVVCR